MKDKNTLKTTIMVPTYNESDNIKPLLKQILALQVKGHAIHVLVVDDNSPDGTSTLVSEIAAREPRVKLLVRTDRRGRGTAGIDGFKAALRDGADYIIEMDADFSHDPRYIPDLIAAADRGADLVCGSRFVPGGADEDRGPVRRTITKFAGLYICIILGLKIHDPTGGFRLFKRRTLEAVDLDHIMAVGPAIVPETLYKTVVKGFTVAEVPIEFIDRRKGVSKLDTNKLVEVLFMVLRLRGLNMRGRLFHGSTELLPKRGS